MCHTDIDCDAIQALARVDHRVAQVHLTVYVGLRLDPSGILPGTSRNSTCTSGERPAFFYFLLGGSLATFAIRSYAPGGVCDFSVSAKASLPISLSLTPFRSSSFPVPSPFEISFTYLVYSSPI